MTAARDRPRAGRLAGRGAARRRARPTCSPRSARQPGVGAGAAGRLRRHRPASRPPPAARRRQTGPGQRARAARRLRARRSRASSALLAGLGHRRAARPADRGQPARRARRHGHDRPRRRPAGARSRSTASSTCPQPTRCSSRSARPPARSPRRRPTTSSCCPQRDVRPRRARRAGRRRRSTRGSSHAPARQPERRLHAGHRATRATSRRSSPARGLVGDNLGTALDNARQDALYAAAAVPVPRRPGRDPRRARHRVDRRRRAPTAAAATPRCCAPAAPRRASSCASRSAETALAGALGVAARPRRRAARSARPRSAPRASARPRSPPSLWAGGAALAGLAIAAGAIALPAWRDARSLTVAGQRAAGRPARPRARGGRATALDFIALAGAGARLLAGVAATATSSCSRPRASRRSRSTGTPCSRPCSAGSAPGCSPTASPTSSLVRGRAPLARLLRPVAGELVADRRGDDGPPAAAARQGGHARRADRRVRRLDGGLQLHLPAAGRGRRAADQRRRRDRHRVAGRARRAAGRGAARPTCAGVAQRRAAAAPLRLRRRRPAGPLRRAAADDRRGRASCRTAGSRAAAPSSSWTTSAARPDGVLVSAETVKRLPAAPGRPDPPAAPGRPHQAVQDGPVPLHRRRQGVPDRAEGLVPRRQRRATSRRPTGSDAVGAFLVQTDGTSPATRRPAHRARSWAPSAQVTDIVNQRRVVGSNLTAVELSGLTKVELGFALVLAIAASGLALGLGFQERRRTFAIATALGATQPPARRVRLGRVAVRDDRRAGPRHGRSPS